jgi:hypothetical protein
MRFSYDESGRLIKILNTKSTQETHFRYGADGNSVVAEIDGDLLWRICHDCEQDLNTLFNLTAQKK